MTPQQWAILIVVAIIVAAAFIFDKKKADAKRAQVDSQNGKHDADFSQGYAVNKVLFLKDRVKGYIQWDITNAVLADLYVNPENKAMVFPCFYDADGKEVKGERGLGTSRKQVEEMLTAICAAYPEIKRADV